jgi:hypothetical protein
MARLKPTTPTSPYSPNTNNYGVRRISEEIFLPPGQKMVTFRQNHVGLYIQGVSVYSIQYLDVLFH